MVEKDLSVSIFRSVILTRTRFDLTSVSREEDIVSDSHQKYPASQCTTGGRIHEQYLDKVTVYLIGGGGGGGGGHLTKFFLELVFTKQCLDKVTLDFKLGKKNLS